MILDMHSIFLMMIFNNNNIILWCWCNIQLLKYSIKLFQDDSAFEERVSLDRTVGLFGGISLIIGTMIGSGIFASAASVSKYSGSVGMSLVVWSGSGILAMLGGLCYVELGLMMPESGGEYIYIKEAMGDLPAFLFVYVSNIVLRPAAITAICVAAGDYSVEPFLVYEHVAANHVLIAKLIAAFYLSKLFEIIFVIFLITAGTTSTNNSTNNSN